MPSAKSEKQQEDPATDAKAVWTLNEEKILLHEHRTARHQGVFRRPGTWAVSTVLIVLLSTVLYFGMTVSQLQHCDHHYSHLCLQTKYSGIAEALNKQFHRHNPGMYPHERTGSSAYEKCRSMNERFKRE